MHECVGGMRTLGTFIGTDEFVKAELRAQLTPRAPDGPCVPDAGGDLPDFARVCCAVADYGASGQPNAQHSATGLLIHCVCTKLGYLLESLPPHITAEFAHMAHALVLSAYCEINELTEAEARRAFDRLVLPPGMLGCGLRFYPDTAPAGYASVRLHTAEAVIAAIEGVEAAQAAADAAAAAADTTAAAATEPSGSMASAANPNPPLADISTDIAAALRLLPESARAEVDMSDIGGDTDAMKKYKHVLTHAAENARHKGVRTKLEAAVAAEVPDSELHEAAQRNLAHYNSCDGGWLTAPALWFMRHTNTHFGIRLRRYLRLPIPICESIGGGVGSSRPPRSADGKPFDVFGDFTLSVFGVEGAPQWFEFHEEVKYFFMKAAEQAGITSISKEERADGATTMHRPGDIRIGSVRHGWKAADGKSLLISTSPTSAPCATCG